LPSVGMATRVSAGQRCTILYAHDRSRWCENCLKPGKKRCLGPVGEAAAATADDDLEPPGLVDDESDDDDDPGPPGLVDDESDDDDDAAADRMDRAREASGVAARIDAAQQPATLDDLVAFQQG